MPRFVTVTRTRVLIACSSAFLRTRFVLSPAVLFCRSALLSSVCPGKVVLTPMLNVTWVVATFSRRKLLRVTIVIEIVPHPLGPSKWYIVCIPLILPGRDCAFRACRHAPAVINITILRSMQVLLFQLFNELVCSRHVKAINRVLVIRHI